MRTRIFIVACVLLVSVAALIFWEQSGWQATLHRELHQYSHGGCVLLDPLVIHMRQRYIVPARTSKILEEGRREELLAYLSELRQSADPTERLMVDQWTQIVREGLRGTPQTMSCWYESNTEEVVVRVYSIALRFNRPHP